MRLHAVTICVGYSDFLAGIVGNRLKFDRWVVVTVADDDQTIRLCALEGLDCCIVKDMKPGGQGFHAAYNKSRFINAGLRFLREQCSILQKSDCVTDDWAVMLDADVLLPTDFRERLSAMYMQLDPQKLYGLQGRRVAGTGDEFHGLAAVEPV